jgi:hypothetical protein
VKRCVYCGAPALRPPACRAHSDLPSLDSSLRLDLVLISWEDARSLMNDQPRRFSRDSVLASQQRERAAVDGRPGHPALELKEWLELNTEHRTGTPPLGQ